MFELQGQNYPYMEELNEGILRQFRAWPGRGRVLDVGCGRGALGEAIRASGSEVWGIECSGEACRSAMPRLDRLVQADLLDFDLVGATLGKERFARIIFSDVLEHVVDPLAVLRFYAGFLAPEGQVLISLPNAAVWTNRFRWFFGRIRYADTGVMDRTHVRFFSFATARLLVEEAGLEVEKRDFTPFLVRAGLPALKRLFGWRTGGSAGNPRAIVDSGAFRFYSRFVYPLERVLASLWKPMFAFRIILVARKAVKPTACSGGGRESERTSR